MVPEPGLFKVDSILEIENRASLDYWRHLGILKASFRLHSVCTIIGFRSIIGGTWHTESKISSALGLHDNCVSLDYRRHLGILKASFRLYSVCTIIEDEKRIKNSVQVIHNPKQQWPGDGHVSPHALRQRKGYREEENDTDEINVS